MDVKVQLRASLKGHSNPIYAICSDPNGKNFYTAGNDKGIVVWDLEKLAFKKVLCPISHSVYALVCDPFSPYVYAGDSKGNLIKAHTETGKNEIFNFSNSPIFDLKVGDFGDLWVLYQNGTLMRFETSKNEIVVSKNITDSKIRSFSLSSDYKQIIVGDYDGRIFHFDAKTLEEFQRFHKEGDSILSVSFDSDDQHVWMGTRNAELIKIRVKDLKIMHSWVPHMYAVYDIKVHPSLPYFATASRDKDIKIWDLHSYMLKRSISQNKDLPAHRLSVNQMIWMNDETLISISDDRMVLVWDVKFTLT